MIDILSKVLKEIKPEAEEIKRINDASAKIIGMIEKNAKELGVNVQAVLGGSASRGTNMKGNHDLDFFIRFESEKDIKDYYKSLITKSFDNFKITHGTRDYFRGEFLGFRVEFVPSIKYDSPKKAANSADISYFHIDYLKKFFEKNQKLCDEVLLLKQFLKANDVYGAESARGGFSGYVCELLIIYFKSFYNMLEFFDSSTPKTVIDIEKHYKDSESAIKSLDKNKTSGPLIVVDPLLPLRNASSSINYDSFSKFLFKARLFLINNDPKLFNIRGFKLSLAEERSRRRGTRLLSFKLKESYDFDILKAKVLRKMGIIESLLKKEGFSIYSYGITDDSYAFFELESLKVSSAKRHYGPFVWAESKHFRDFLDKWSSKGIGKPYVFDNKLAVDVKRKEDAKDIIKEFLGEYL
jgi:tRNA nucleotidyltransferase (CCA-adding enzyme)